MISNISELLFGYISDFYKIGAKLSRLDFNKNQDPSYSRQDLSVKLYNIWKVYAEHRHGRNVLQYSIVTGI